MTKKKKKNVEEYFFLFNNYFYTFLHIWQSLTHIWSFFFGHILEFFWCYKFTALVIIVYTIYNIISRYILRSVTERGTHVCFCARDWPIAAVRWLSCHPPHKMTVVGESRLLTRKLRVTKEDHTDTVEFSEVPRDAASLVPYQTRQRWQRSPF